MYGIEKEFLAHSVFADTSWKDGLIIRMLELDFIQESQVDEALSILNRFEDEDEVFEALYDSCDNLSRAIANATQL